MNIEHEPSHRLIAAFVVDSLHNKLLQSRAFDAKKEVHDGSKLTCRSDDAKPPEIIKLNHLR